MQGRLLIVQTLKYFEIGEEAMFKHKIITKAICLLLIIMSASKLAGCSMYNNTSAQSSNSALSQAQSDSRMSQSEVENYISNLKEKQRLTLPDGSTWNGADWNDLDIDLSVLGLKSDAELTSLVGNHAEIVSQEEVTTKSGKALLLLVDRTNTAAEQAKSSDIDHTYEYWLIQRDLQPYPGRDDMKLAYVLIAKFTSSPETARSHILELAKNWSVSD